MTLPAAIRRGCTHIIVEVELPLFPGPPTQMPEAASNLGLALLPALSAALVQEVLGCSMVSDALPVVGHFSARRSARGCSAASRLEALQCLAPQVVGRFDLGHLFAPRRSLALGPQVLVHFDARPLGQSALSGAWPSGSWPRCTLRRLAALVLGVLVLRAR